MATTPQQEPTMEPTLEPTLEDLRNPGGNTTELDRSEESSTTSLYKAAIGSSGQNFYLPVFTRFEAADRGGISWNWAASLNTMNWLAYRKLWSAALAYAGTGVGLALLIFGIGRLVFRFSEPVEMALLVAYLAAIFVVPGLFANALLHADCRKRMARALAANTTLPEACSMLAKQAPSRIRLIVLAGLNALLAGALATVYLNFPAAGSLPKDTLGSLAGLDPLGTRAAAPAPAASSAPSAPSASSASSAPSAPLAPSASAPATMPATAASAAPVLAASSPTAAASTPKPALPLVTATAAGNHSAAATAPATKASAAAISPSKPASAPSKSASATGGRVAVGVVQQEAERKLSAPARAASAPASAPAVAASSPQELGKVYRSEPAPIEAPVKADAALKAVVPVAGKSNTPAAALPSRAPAATKADGKYLINVGLFAQEANVSNALGKLKEGGLTAYAEELRSPTKGKLTRVRVGPFANQADADAAAAKIRALGLDALVARQ